ncbi:MAG TPA: tetratricopeptide repeat protein, partial [Pseudonocardiaceae bacterium]
MDEADWERRVALLWASIDELSDEDLLVRMAKLVAERPAADPIALFEHGSALDSTGHPDMAVDRYRAALAAGLSG